jgi:hypothetical protein
VFGSGGDGLARRGEVVRRRRHLLDILGGSFDRLGDGVELVHRVGDAIGAGFDLLCRLLQLGDRLVGRRLHLFERRIDRVGLFLRLGRQALDLVRDDGEAVGVSVVARVCGLDGGVQCEQVRLLRDVVDAGQCRLDGLDPVVEPADFGGQFLARRSNRLADVHRLDRGRSTVGAPRCRRLAPFGDLLGTGGDFLDGRAQIGHLRDDPFDLGDLFAGAFVDDGYLIVDRLGRRSDSLDRARRVRYRPPVDGRFVAIGHVLAMTTQSREPYERFHFLRSVDSSSRQNRE